MSDSDAGLGAGREAGPGAGREAGPGAGRDAELPDEDAPWADGPGHLDGEEVPPPEEVSALGDPPPAEEVPPSPS